MTATNDTQDSKATTTTCSKPAALTAQALCPDTQRLAAHKPATLHATPLLGQSRAVQALAQAFRVQGRYAHVFMATSAGVRSHDLLTATIDRYQVRTQYYDWLYLANPHSQHRPVCISVTAGTANAVVEKLVAWLAASGPDRLALGRELEAMEPSAGLMRYMEMIGDRSFDDLPGAELANIIVSHDREQRYFSCEQVTEASLFGSIRLQSVQGTISSELHLIEPGALLKANGGLLVIDAEALLRTPGLWSRLKHVLKTSLFHWPQPGDANIAAYYEPEPIPVKLKVVLMGDRDIYAQLRDLDADFDNLFPFLADIAGHYSIAQHPIADYFNYLQYAWEQASVLPLADSAYAEILRFVARITDYQHELSLDTIAIMQLLREANSIAIAHNAETISAEDIQASLQQAKERSGYIAELSRRSILEEQVYIATSGEAIGQVNGLTVITAGGTEFGEPSRITATVHYGDGDIIDIERKSELSGNIHTKGVMILTAFIANLFARNEPMSLSATIVFEQSYHEVDGDSASLAELCCLLSALADLPLQQGLASTGAIDQFGRVQAIGAVNEKIEGYFEVCQARGLTGEQGVIIPTANLSQLNLSTKVIDAVAAKQFHVYAVGHVSEAIALLARVSEQDLYERIRDRLALLHQLENSRPTLLQRLFGRR